MKISIKEFSTLRLSELRVADISDLEEVIAYRQQAFCHTEEYVKIQKELRTAIQQLKNSEVDIEILNDLEDSIGRVEIISYSDAYRAGMVDLMTALTFNRLEITDAKYLCCEEQEEEGMHNG